MRSLSRFILGLILVLPMSSMSQAQQRRVLVRFKNAKTIQEAQSLIGSRHLKVLELLVPQLDLYLVEADEGLNAHSVLSQLNRNEAIHYASLDEKVTLRETPNDSEFNRQWSLYNPESRADIKAPEAWNLGTGGLDYSGNEIIVAVVDAGMELTHPDLVQNLWVNKGEIPNNQMDDDGNGYVDDINGWNAYDNNGTLPSEGHGTHVAGIVGAVGNNDKQVAGVNWNVKIMAIAGSDADTAVIARAYGYAIKQKELFLESKGAKGANVVVTNSSFGIDRGNCNAPEYQVWNDLYNEMGKVGILSAAAAPNHNWDVDQVGDIPTGCSSPYIVSVTNTTGEDKKYESAGYGRTQIDIGAPGTQILSTYLNASVAVRTGTSMATPHIAGAIALMHHTASRCLYKVGETNPSEGALEMKSILLQSADPLATLQNTTVSGGRLNLLNAVTQAKEFMRCG